MCGINYLGTDYSKLHIIACVSYHIMQVFVIWFAYYHHKITTYFIANNNLYVYSTEQENIVFEFVEMIFFTDQVNFFKLSKIRPKMEICNLSTIIIPCRGEF